MGEAQLGCRIPVEHTQLAQATDAGSGTGIPHPSVAGEGLDGRGHGQHPSPFDVDSLPALRVLVVTEAPQQGQGQCFRGGIFRERAQSSR